MGAVPALSFVIPVYDEEGNVAALHAELTRVAADLGEPYEIILVNDGSRDGTLARLEALREADPHLRIVDLDGNFGEAAALSAGFAHARAELVVTLDGDGQNDPADVPRVLDVTLDGAQAAVVAVTLVAVTGALGWPGDRPPAAGVAVTAAIVAVLGLSVAHNVNRWARAQRDGVFRVRRVV